MHITSCPRVLAVRRLLVFGFLFASLVLPVRLSAQPAKPAAPAKTASPAQPAKAGAGPRTIVIVAGDDMKWDKVTIEAKPGEELRVRLTPKGAMPKIAMSHNFVLLKPGTDAAAFVNAGATSRATDYIPPAQKAQVIANTPLAGNNETVEITFKVPAAAGRYPYVCTFPGHFAAGMKGMLVVKK